MPTCTQKLLRWTQQIFDFIFFVKNDVSFYIYTFGVRYDMLLHDSWLIFYKNNPKYCAMNRLPSVTPPPHICQMWNVNSRFSLLINHDQWSTGWNYKEILLLLTIFRKNFIDCSAKKVINPFKYENEVTTMETNYMVPKNTIKDDSCNLHH